MTKMDRPVLPWKPGKLPWHENTPGSILTSEAIRRLGAEVRHYGEDAVDTEAHARKYAAANISLETLKEVITEPDHLCRFTEK